jgi:mutator protein MutT
VAVFKRKSKLMIEVVGAAINNDGKILLTQRSCDALDGKWEFPGGKVEIGETHQQALQREILEELGIEISVGNRVAPNKFKIAEQPYCLYVYHAVVLKGEPVAGEHHSIRWVPLAELLNFDLAPADVPIAMEAIKYDWEYTGN